MLRIGQFSKLGRTTVKTLRFYDEAGLLRPAQVDTFTGYRYYTTAQLTDLYRIQSLRQMGFSTDEIRTLADGRGVRAVLESRKAGLEETLARTAAQLLRLENYLLQEESPMELNVVVKDIPACTVFSAREVLPAYADIAHFVPEAGAKAAALNPGLRCCEPEYCFCVYHDEGHKESDVDVEVCQTVEAPGKEGDGISFKQLPPVTVASALYQGPYDRFPAVYAVLAQWVEQNGYAFAGPPRECYIDGIWNKDDPADWLTEIQIPITK
jgi:DNA-binding transcriptional MerR regulator/effector-binding domain-containing protein